MLRHVSNFACSFALATGLMSEPTGCVGGEDLPAISPVTGGTEAPGTETPGTDPKPVSTPNEAGADASTPTTVDAATIDATTTTSEDADAEVVIADSGTPIVDAGPPDSGPGPGHVKFDTARAVFAGTGCSAADTTVTANGSRLHATFTGMRLQLPRGGGSLADRKNCAIRVPIEVPTGMYVSKLVHQAVYNLDKSSGSTAQIGTNTMFFGVSTAPYTQQFAPGVPVSVHAATASRTDSFAPDSAGAAAMCGSRSGSGLLAVNLALTGQRPNDSEEVLLSVNDFDLREGIEFELSQCP